MNVNNSGVIAIDDQDIWDTWHLIMEKGSYKEFFKKTQRKETLAQGWDDQDGTERYIVPGQARGKSRTLSIPCAILADTANEAWANYEEFMSYIKNCGYFILDIIPRDYELKLLYDDMPQMEDPYPFSNDIGETILQFTLSLIDDFPFFNDTVYPLIDTGSDEGGEYLSDADGEFILYE